LFFVFKKPKNRIFLKETSPKFGELRHQNVFSKKEKK